MMLFNFYGNLLYFLQKLLINSFNCLFSFRMTVIGAFTVPHDAELQIKEHVVLYDSNTCLLKDKSEYLPIKNESRW